MSNSKSCETKVSRVLITEESIKRLKNSISSLQFSNTYEKIYLSKSTANSILPSRSQKAISGSTIQNSARWRDVFESSALKVGPNVYTSPIARAKISASSCPLTVRLARRPKKSFLKSTRPSFLGSWSRSKAVTLNISPAPSQSLPVIIGVCK